MSAENSRLTRAIQRIAKEDPDLRRAIEATKPRGDQPGGTGVGESGGERDRICCDGSTSDNANPGAETRDPDANAKDGLDPDDPADISDNLSGVVDCATGQPICFEGGDFIPPEGWEDAGEKPIDPEYVPGIYYQAKKGIFIDEYHPTVAGARQRICPPYCECNEFYGRSNQSCQDCYSVQPGDSWTSNCSGLYEIRAIKCSGANHPFCDEPPPTLDEWPEDGCVSLAIKGGVIVGSKYDPENTGAYSSPTNEIELCDPDSGESVLISPSATGGWKSISSLEGNIDPDTNSGYLYSESGEKIRQISPSEFRDTSV